MNVELLRKRGAERVATGVEDSLAASPSLLRTHLGRLKWAMTRHRTRSEKMRLLSLLFGLTCLFGIVSLVLVFFFRPPLGFVSGGSAEELMRQRIVCPTDTLINIPPLRADVKEGRTPGYAFAASVNASELGSPPTVAGLHAFCASRVSAVPQWASGSWRQWDALSPQPLDAAIFNLTIAPKSLANASYTAVGCPFCLAGGALYLPEKRMSAGGAVVFENERMPVLPLTDAVLQSAARSHTSAGLHVVPAMGMLLSGYWIATHFFHLVTDALETLYGAVHTLEGGALAKIPTQTVMVHSMATNWVDRRGDQAKKLEFSAALANAFSSPLLRDGSPYATSFLFRPDSPYCVGRGEEKDKRRPFLKTASPNSSQPRTASTVCFCDGLLVTTIHHPFMNSSIYYGIQDWAARQFGTPSYTRLRNVREMERLRLTQSPAWAARFWPTEVNATSSPSNSTAPYQPRVLFIRRTTRLVADGPRYAQWMRELGFRVEEVFMEKLSAAEQHHLGRYADVVVGMHGLGIGHAMWMEREPHECRSVIEFRPWVIQAMPMQPLRMLGLTMKFNFVPIFPVDVAFGPSVKDPKKERELLMSMQGFTKAFTFPGFTDQTTYYDDAEVRRVFLSVQQRLDRCLPK